MIPDATTALKAALFDRYRIERELGAGGMATVYLAEDLKHKRKVAIKVLRDELAAALGPERFLREIETTANLRHPHILPLYDSGEAGGFLYYVMPLIEGESLRDRLCREKPLAIEDAVQITREVADALGYAHTRGVIHRDIKPENILLENGHAVVADFGIAKAVSTLDGGNLTQTGLAVGTPAYMSPEQVLADGALDGRSDLYSLGCVLFEMLTGEPPFAAATSQRTIARRLTEPPPDASASHPAVPRAVSQVVSRCLAREPGERWATGAQLTDALRKSATGSISATTALDSGAERTRSRLPWIAVLSFASRDPSLADLAEGLTEDITTGLAQFSHLQVVARQSAAHLPPGTDLRRVGEALGARYVIDGSLRKSGTTMRLSAQLVDAQTGTHLWAETFDRDLGTTSIFALQDDLTDRIVVTVADPFGVLVRAMATPLRDRTVDDLTASELVIRVWAYSYQVGPEEHARLRDGFERALEREPDHAEAWAALADIYWEEQLHGYNPRPDALGRARRAAERAVEIDPASQFGWAEVAIVHYFSGDAAAFRPAAERAIALNPRNSGTGAILATIFAFSGDWERGYAMMRRLMDLNPQHAGWFHFVPFHYHFKKGEYLEALAAVKRVNMPQLPWNYTTVAMVCAALGRWDEARQAADSLRRLFPAHAPSLGRGPSGWFHDRELEDRENAWLLKAMSLGDSSPAPAPPTQSIAVLPFANMSADPQDEFFAEGITEEIINALAQLDGLQVAARTSCFAFKGKNEDLRSVGEKLGVQHVLEGSVRKAGSRVRITAQLINAADGYHLWSERYDRELHDIFAIQDELAGAIAAKLSLTLLPRSAAKRSGPKSVEAYELLLKGRALLWQRGRAILDAIPVLERAVVLDPELGDAYGWLGDAWRLKWLYGMAKAAETIPLALAAIDRALALDADNPQALAALANIRALYHSDREGSLALSARALARDPRFVQALCERSVWQALQPKASPELRAEAFRNVRRAREIDPLSSWAAGIEVFVHLAAGRHADAVRVGREAVALDSAAFTGRWVLVWSLSAAGQDEEALALAQESLAMSGRNPRLLTEMAAIHARRGYRAAVQEILDELTQRRATGFVEACAVGCVAASAGDLAEARALVAQGIAEHEPYFQFALSPAWASFRADPAGMAMLQAVGL